MGEDWSRWLDESPDDTDRGEPAARESARAEAPVVRLRRREESSGRDDHADDDHEDDDHDEFDAEGGSVDSGSERAPRPILVVGGCGGAGTTTTVLGIAGEMASAGISTVAVDATAAGSDLALRGADEHLHPISLQSWLYGRGDGRPAPLKECLSLSASGIGLLWRDAAPLRQRASYLNVGRAVAQAGYTAVYDGGHPIAGRQLRPLLDDAEVALVLAIPARSDAANRLRVTLDWLDDEFGTGGQGDAGIVGDTTIVISHQNSDTDSRVADHLRDHLSGWVRDIREIPYDPHLARGELVRHAELDERTRRAYRRLLAGVAS